MRRAVLSRADLRRAVLRRAVLRQAGQHPRLRPRCRHPTCPRRARHRCQRRGRTHRAADWTHRRRAPRPCSRRERASRRRARGRSGHGRPGPAPTAGVCRWCGSTRRSRLRHPSRAARRRPRPTCRNSAWVRAAAVRGRPAALGWRCDRGRWRAAAAARSFGRAAHGPR
ncbi:MAG: hypothetical protein AB8I08_34255 [Sandaracinaceae bacterium]